MPIFAMKRVFQNGKTAKTAVVYFEAKDKDEAFQAFGAGGFWRYWRESVHFTAQFTESVPKNAKVLNAAEVIEANREDEEDEFETMDGG